MVLRYFDPWISDNYVHFSIFFLKVAYSSMNYCKWECFLNFYATFFIVATNTWEKQFREENTYFVSQSQSFQSTPSKPEVSQGHHGERAWERKLLSSWQPRHREEWEDNGGNLYLSWSRLWWCTSPYLSWARLCWCTFPARPNFLIRSPVRTP